MNAADRQTFRLVHKNARALALYAVSAAPDGYVVTVRPPTRSLDQNALLHSLLSAIARSGIEIGGCRRTVDELKFLFVVAHAHETNTPVELVEFEGHQIALRESTASMSKARSSSLIEFIKAWCAQHGIDNEGNYEPGNCRWATAREQARNTRRSKLTFDSAVAVAMDRLRGESAATIAVRYGISESLPREIVRGRTWPDALAEAKRRLANVA